MISKQKQAGNCEKFIDKKSFFKEPGRYKIAYSREENKI
jgi:hypothetical protein